MLELMLFLLKFTVWSLVVLFTFHFVTRKYLNPYKLIFIIAKKGGGKTTTLTKFAIKHLRKGWKVYTTFPVPGCFLLEYSDIGYYDLPERSLVVIDEVGMIWDNRDHENFPPEVRDWFKLQRHRKVKVIMASQDFDVDKKIRKLCDDMYLLVNVFRVFSYAKRIIRRIDIVEANGSSGSESRIVDQLQYETFLLFWLGSRKLTFIPNWVKYFDSFDAPKLKKKVWARVPDLDENEKFSMKLRQRLKSKGKKND